MSKSFYNSAVIFGLALASCLFFLMPASALADPNPQINYQGKLTDNTGVAVADGDYDMEFKLYDAATGGTTLWTETLTTTNQVTVTNGLFSVMLGSTSPLTSVNFNQTVYLGVNVASDGEMAPRKVLGTVPAAFEAFQLGGVASSSFLRSDEADEMAATTAATLLSITQSGAGDILNLFDDDLDLVEELVIENIQDTWI